MNEKIAQAIETMQKGYILDPNRILADFREETAEIKGYHGRELLELLQNAVDELAGTVDRSVCISLNDGLLTICNNGNTFTYNGFISLMYSNLSPKHDKSEYIGNKGTGFRSILNWADSVRIYSGELSVEFSSSYATEMLTNLMEHDSVKAFCQTHEDVHLATLVAPRIIENLVSKTYDTIIEVTLKDGILDKVNDQIKKINAKTLLFLEKLERLTIEFECEAATYEKFRHNGKNETSTIKIETVKNGELIEKEEWAVMSREGYFGKQKYGVVIAYKADMSVKPDVLYSYFRTKILFPVPAVVHATFDLNADRNHLAETEANKHILKVVCNALVDLALSTGTECVGYTPLALLSTIGKFPNDLSWDEFSIRDYYYDAISEKNVLPTVNGKYISFNENPRLYGGMIADYLRGDAFSSLMPHTGNATVIDMIRSIANYKNTSLRYEYTDIVNGINLILPGLSINERAALWLAFIGEYGNEITQNNKPDFVLDANGKVVSDSIQVFLPPEGTSFPSPPDFTKIVFLNKELVTALRKLQGNEGTLRSLASELSKFNVREYNLANIINAVISKLRNREHQNSKKTRQCYEETLEWLWRLWNANVLKSEMPAVSTIPLMNRNGFAKNATDLYFGHDFGNEIAESLFTGADNYFVAVPRKITLSETTRSQYIEFLSTLDVSRFPRKKTIQLSPLPQEYKEQIYSSIKKYPLVAGDNIYKNAQDLRNAYFSYASVVSVERIEEILEKSSTKSILAWIRNDDRLQEILKDYEPSSSRGYISNAYQQRNREINGERLASYIRFVFSTSKWIEVNGKRYAPKQCLFVNKLGVLFAPLVVSPDLSLFVENPNRKNSETITLQDVLERMGAAADYSELDTETFYSLLLKLPEADLDGELSKALYTSVLKAGGLRKLDEKSPAYKQFMQSGKVYCKSAKAFEAIQSVFYLTEKTVSRDILKDFMLIAIPARQSQENIKRYFGVSPLKIKGSVVGEPIVHPESLSFEQDFNDFICYAFCSRVDTAKQGEISTVKALRVRLCTHVDADYGKGKVVLGENSYIRGKNCVYVQAPAGCLNLQQLKSNVNFCSTIAELFMTTIGIQDDALYGSVRSLYEKAPHNRNALILHDFDDFDILERAREALKRTQSAKEMFVAACLLIGGKSAVERMQNDIDKINFSEFASTSNAVPIICVLKSLKTDVNDFNEKSENSVDLCPYYSGVLNVSRTENEKKYKNGLFAILASEPLIKKRGFLKQYQQYREYQFSPENSVNYDCQSEFARLFGGVIEAEDGENADSAWKTNKAIFALGKDLKIVDDMLVNPELDSLLYFAEFDVLDGAYTERKAEIDAIQKQEAAVLSAQAIPGSSIITIATASPANSGGGNGSPSSHSGNRAAGMKRERNISDWGAFAERLVYEHMKATYNNVVWASENAKKEGVNPDGIGGLGYDLKYTDSNGDVMYVEIKSSAGSNLTFVITENELNFAEANATQYEVILVTSVSSDEERKIYRLPHLFNYADGEDRLCNSKFSTSVDSYTVRCQINETTK